MAQPRARDGPLFRLAIFASAALADGPKRLEVRPPADVPPLALLLDGCEALWSDLLLSEGFSIDRVADPVALMWFSPADQLVPFLVDDLAIDNLGIADDHCWITHSDGSSTPQFRHFAIPTPVSASKPS
ncbi:hypothetical protein [Halocatena halophila]|uniref:hypothetical protein n=1 Tax=Halocatena halophila TaxID=2814576 RepID=UPI002ED24BCB